MNKSIQEITNRIIERSIDSRFDYLSMLDKTIVQDPPRKRLSCGNFAHACASHPEKEKKRMQDESAPNIGIVTAYNDMLSAHQPYADYPTLIKETAYSLGASAQVAGGVPAMCDGVTQGQTGMDMSLFSRDVIAMATAISLSHNTFDAAACLGVCDKIVPGLFIGALEFGHLPFVFIPAGPMPSGISNKEKAAVRQDFAQGKASEEKLLATEIASYHSPGTCTFYGTANTNQVLMEILGLQLAGSSFINPGTPLREALTKEAIRRLLNITNQKTFTPLKDVVTEKSVVNAIVLLCATGGSTNLTLHLLTMAKSAGIIINWDDVDQISKATPLLARVYPNGEADVNHFEQAGGLPFVVNQLRSAGLLNEDVKSIMGEGLDAYTRKPELLEGNEVKWGEPIAQHNNINVLREIDDPFASEGGLRVMKGNLGTGLVKISAVKEEHRIVEAPCKVFESQHDLKTAFEKGDLDCDHVAVVRFQGPSVNGMPELHKLTPYLGVLQDKGFNVALVTDGRMSGASGKVLAAIHIAPEANKGGLLAYVEEGDIVRVDAENGEVSLLVDDQVLKQRSPAAAPHIDATLGRRLFSVFRDSVNTSTDGANVFGF
jgi:phosphogluconate dehydratase